MIQISILSGTSPAVERQPLPGESAISSMPTAGTSSGCLPLCAALCGGSGAGSKQAIARLYLAVQSCDPCIYPSLSHSESNSVNNSSCLGKARNRKGRCEVAWTWAVHPGWVWGRRGAQSWASGCPWQVRLLRGWKAPPARAHPVPPSSSPSASAAAPTPPSLSVWASLPLTLAHHQPPAPPHEHGVSSEYSSPIIKNMSFLNFLQVSPPSISVSRYITASDVPCPPPAVYTIFPATKIPCCPLPHPQRAYKLRAPSLLVGSFSAVQ